MGIQYVLDKMKLKAQLNRYLSDIKNDSDYLKEKTILEAYCFHKDKFNEMRENAKWGGVERMIDFHVERFEEYLSTYEDKGHCLEEGMELEKEHEL